MQEEFYLLFTDEYKYAAQRILKRGFKHVFLLKKTEMGWVEIRSSYFRLNIDILPYLATDDVARAYRKVSDATLVKLTRNENAKILPFNFVRFMFCTGITQYIAGFNTFAITPYQLYKKLAKNKIKNFNCEVM